MSTSTETLSCSAKCPMVRPHRPEMDTEWTYIREPIETNSMVLKGLLPETEYQFVIRAVNMHGASPPSPINSPVRTLSESKSRLTLAILSKATQFAP